MASKGGGGPIRPSSGLKATLQAKTRARRDKQVECHTIESGQPEGSNRPPQRHGLAYVAIDSLKPASRRIRRKDKAQDRRLGVSIDHFDFTDPITVGSDLRIIDGHARWEAAKKAGLTELPVTILSHLTEAKRRLLAITLNRTAETGNWDDDNLGIELEELIELKEEVLVSGFEQAEIDTLLLKEDVEEDDGSIPRLGELAISQPGDVWILGRHRLVQGDARDPSVYAVLMLDGERIRLALVDPPYNVAISGHVTNSRDHREFAMASGEMGREEFGTFNRDWMALVGGLLIDGGLIAAFCDWRSVDLILAAGRELGFELLNLVVWSKTNAGQGSLWRSGHELLPIFKIGTGPHTNNVHLGRWGRWRSNVWTYPGASSMGSDARKGLTEHPTPKPLQL